MSEHDQDYGFETLAIHAGAAPDPTTGARATPIYQTTSFVFDDVDHAASLFNLQRFGNIYSRITNPTVSVLEERIAALEGGIGVRRGEWPRRAVRHLPQPDGARRRDHLLDQAVRRLDHPVRRDLPEVRLARALRRPDRAQAVQESAPKRTKAIFVESASNPDGVICDLEAIAAIAHGAGVPLVVDNTMPTPYLCQPVRHGADIVVHSMTKYIGGHLMGGVIVDGGTFDWFQSDKFPALTAPTKAYHGIRFAETFGDFGRHALQGGGSARHRPLPVAVQRIPVADGGRDAPLRMQRHVENAQAVAEFLAGHPLVAWVSYPGLPGSPHHALAKRYTPRHRRGHLRGQGRLSDGHQGGGGMRAAFAPRQHRRHALADHPSGLDHAPPAGRGAAQSRRRARGDPPVDRPRDRRRHHRGSRPGAHRRGPGHHRERGVAAPLAVPARSEPLWKKWY